MIRFWCQCGRQLKASENLIGQPAQCPLCRRLTIVPETDMPRTADFPPVPPRGSVNASGEITRGSTAAQVARHPVPASEKEDPPGWLGRAWTKVGAAAIVAGSLVIIAGMLLPSVSRVREASPRMREVNNHKQIALALHNFQANNGYLPAATAYQTRDGRSGLSWRVAILPYIERDDLFKQFKLDEPWDSPNNIQLLPMIPTTYLQPDQTDRSGMTHYQVFVGPGTAFEEVNKQRRVPPPNWRDGICPGTILHAKDFPDGTANTILVATARTAVPWTKPDDLPFAPNAPLAPLSERFEGGVNVSMADGSVRLIRRDAEAAIKAAVTRNGNENVPLP